jgi:hypothetical protein
MSSTPPYTKMFDELATADAAAPNLYTLRYPGRGTLRRVIVELGDTDSDSASEGGSGGSIDLYSREVDPDAPDQMYLIYRGEFDGAHFNSGELDVKYSNSEGGPSNIVRLLYAVLTPGGTGTRTPRISLTMESPQF